MFLRSTTRKKDGKVHRYWSVVENCRTKAGRVVQRHVLYLGEINDAQRAVWCKTIEVLEEGCARPTQVAIFPPDRLAPEMDCAVVQVRLERLRLAAHLGTSALSGDSRSSGAGARTRSTYSVKTSANDCSRWASQRSGSSSAETPRPCR